MKYTYLFYLGFILFSLVSCSRRSAPISLLKPAELTLPRDIESMVTLDRSKPSGTLWTIAEALLTGEAIGQDREGRRMAIQALGSGLTRTPRFNVISSGLEWEGSRSGSRFPMPLPWSEVESMCRQYNTDVLVALEMFDSDTPIQVRKEKRKDKEGKEYVEFIVEQQVHIRTGWRIYDPQNRIILDEHVTTAHRMFSNRGRDSTQVIRARRWQREDVRAIAVLAGQAYARRIAPLWINESRSYFVKGAPDEKVFYQKANAWVKLGNWEEAYGIYKDIYERQTAPKWAGRAAFNLAVASEQLGRLDEALKWSEQAYVQFQLRSARNYYQLLQRRTYDEAKLHRQMD